MDVAKSTKPRSAELTLANWWRARSKAFRVWLFAAGAWFTLSLLFFMLVNPHSIWNNALYEISQGRVAEDAGPVLFTVLVPPLFSWALYFGYQRFVR